MSDLARRLWIEMISAEYEAAVDANNFERQEQLWALAAANPDLEAVFLQLHEDWAKLAEQSRTQPLATTQDVDMIRDAVATHLKAPEITAKTGPLTVRDVAEELSTKLPPGLPPAAYQVLEQLRQSHAELPKELGLSKLIAWAEAQFGAAPRELWKAFQDAASTVTMRQAEQLSLAARRAKRQGGA